MPKKEQRKKASKNEDSNKKIKFKQKHPKLAIVIRIMIIAILLMCVIGAGVVAGLMYGLFGNEFTISSTDLSIAASNSVVVDSSGNVIANLSGDEKRKVVTLSEMNQYLPKAYIAIEDERFYKHNGVDLLRTGKAVATYVLKGGKSSFGGSTITQQLVKNITTDDDRSGLMGAVRKLKEWAKAYQVEQLMSKDQILELYLNIIFVGDQYHGVELGAEYYFNKSAKDLTITECAFLAGINNSPNSYDPFSSSKPYASNDDKKSLINKRTKTVLNKMKELGYITEEQYNTSCKEVDSGIEFKKGDIATVSYSYHTEALLDQVIAQVSTEKGVSKQIATNYVYSSGLKIYSTQKADVQTALETEGAKTSKYCLKSATQKDEDGNPEYSQAAMVVIDQSTGYVVGCLGGLGDKGTRELNRATQSVRQTGSSMKPIAVVAPGVQEGIISGATVYNDADTLFGTYNPKDYNNFRGLISIRDAVETSQNIPFIKAMAELTPAKSIEYLKNMGITTLDDKKDNGLSLAIGGLTNGVSPLEMASAYATIANNGVYIEPTFYTKVEDVTGNVIMTPKQETRRVFSEATAYVTKNILTQTVVGSQGTATYCKINGMDVSAKTGTTNDDKDRWLCGFTNYYTAATWFGYDTPETVKYSGRNPAGQIWSNVMTSIHKGLAASKFEVPSDVVTATICTETGKLASSTCSKTRTEVFVKGAVPTTCDGHTTYVICKDSGKLANEYCTNTEVVSYPYTVEKEAKGTWTTKNSSKSVVPTETCDIHKAPVTTTENKTNTNTNTNNNTVDNKTNNNTVDNKTNNNTPDNKTNNAVNNAVNNTITTQTESEKENKQ